MIQIQKQHGRVGFQYAFTPRELKAIKKRSLGESIESTTFPPTPSPTPQPTAATTNNSNLSPPVKKRRISNKDRRFTWTERNKRTVVEEMVGEDMFAHTPDKHNEICARIHASCCLIDPIFEKIVPAAVKHKLYEIQRKAAGTPEDKVTVLKSYEKSMRVHLKGLGILEKSFCIHDSTGSYLCIIFLQS